MPNVGAAFFIKTQQNVLQRLRFSINEQFTRRHSFLFACSKRAAAFRKCVVIQKTVQLSE